MQQLLSDSGAILAILAFLMNSVFLFSSAFITDIKPGKPDTIAGKIAVVLFEKILVWVNPAELGRRLALKVNPDSLNARKVSRKVTLTPDHVKAINKATYEINLPF